MRVEYSEDMQPRATKRKKKKRKLGPHFFIFLLMIAVSVLIALSLTIWFNVTRFKVTGDTVYSEEEILSVTGIEYGDNLWRVPFKSAENSIEQLLPYVGSAEVSRKLPGTVTIKLTAAKEYAYVNTPSGGAVVDNSFKVLKTAAENKSGLLVIKGAEFTAAEPGGVLGFADAEQREVLEELRDALSRYGFTDEGNYKVTFMDITDSLDLKFIINDRLYIVVGSLNNADNKLIHLKAMLGQVEEGKSAEIDLSDWSEDNKKAPLTYVEDIGIYK